ncbi:hypothetical protein ACVSQB_22885 [Bradyrhizobium elkanii]
MSLYAALGLGGLLATSDSSSALNVGSALLLNQQAKGANPDVVEVRAVVRRGGVVVGPRGNAAAYRSRTVVRGPGVRAGWARPGWYRWPVGGAIAAGAAIGFVTAASAAAWAGAAPAPGMCWYYTDPSRTQGFWDYCPR